MMRVLDIFCGACGGWSLGLHRAGGFETVAACEADPWRRAAFSRNFPRAIMYDDVRMLTAERLHADGAFPDVIVGSPPCQDASGANWRGKGIAGARTGLFAEALRLVREVRPRWVCLENVPRLRSRGYDRVRDDLAAFDYTVWAFVVGSVHAGQIHRRRRVWIIANANQDRRGQGADGLPSGYDHGVHASAAGSAWLDGSVQQSWRPPALDRGDDELPSRLARPVIAAYGDAVDPRISWAIGRAILAAEGRASA